MATSPFVVDRFGGVDLLNDPQEVGPNTAVDLLNVDIDRRGRLRTRDGYAKFTASAGPNPYTQLFAYPTVGASNTLLAVIPDDRTQAIDSTGTVTASQTANPFSSPNPVVCALVGQPGTAAANEKILAYLGNGLDSPLKWDGAAWTVPTITFNDQSTTPATVTTVQAFPKGAPYLYPRSNRLVSTCFDSGSHTQGPKASASSPSHVYFSNAPTLAVPNAVETWNSNDFVILTPGDGQRIHGCAAFQNDLYVFKESRFFVFTGEDTDVDGNPIFNYRTVDVGVGMSGYNAGTEAAQTVCGGSDGVYFLNELGVWRTQGGPPVRVSRALDPFFDGTATTSIKQSALRECQMTWHRERLYVSVRTSASSTNDRLLVFDPALDAWLIHNVPCAGLASFRTTQSTTPELFFSYATGTNDIGQHGSTRTTDAGTAIAWSWTSGAYDMNEPGRVKVTLESRAWGSGTVTVQVANDHGSLDTGSALTLGTAPAILDAWQQIDREGTLWQHKLSGSGQAVVNRFAHYLSFIKPSGVQ